MNLYTQLAGEPSVDGVVVRDIAHQDSVDIMLQVIALYYDMVFIPIIHFEDGF